LGRPIQERKRGTGPGRACARLDASGGEQSARAPDPVRFALVGGLGRRSCHLAVGIKHDSLAFLTSPLTEANMSHNAWLWKEAGETMYLWAAAGVSIGVVFAVVAL
jgi:hypothetical protein